MAHQNNKDAGIQAVNHFLLQHPAVRHMPENERLKIFSAYMQLPARYKTEQRMEELRTQLQKFFQTNDLDTMNHEELVKAAEIFAHENSEIALNLFLIYMSGVNGVANDIQKALFFYAQYADGGNNIAVSEKTRFHEGLSIFNLTRLAITRPIQAINVYNTLQTLHETIAIFSVFACIVFPLAVLSDLINIGKRAIEDSNPQLSKAQKLKNALFKDDRHFHLMNNAMWSGIAIFSYIVKDTPQLAALCPPLLLGGYFMELVQTHYEYNKEIALYNKLLNASKNDVGTQKEIKEKIKEVKIKFADKYFFAIMGFLGTAIMLFPPVALFAGPPMLLLLYRKFGDVLELKHKVAIVALAITAIAVAVSPIGPAALVIGAAMLFISQFISLARKVKAVYDKKTAAATTEEKPDFDAGLAAKSEKKSGPDIDAGLAAKQMKPSR